MLSGGSQFESHYQHLLMMIMAMTNEFEPRKQHSQKMMMTTTIMMTMMATMMMCRLYITFSLIGTTHWRDGFFLGLIHPPSKVREVSNHNPSMKGRNPFLKYGNNGVITTAKISGQVLQHKYTKMIQWNSSDPVLGNQNQMKTKWPNFQQFYNFTKKWGWSSKKISSILH